MDGYCNNVFLAIFLLKTLYLSCRVRTIHTTLASKLFHQHSPGYLRMRNLNQTTVFIDMTT